MIFYLRVRCVQIFLKSENRFLRIKMGLLQSKNGIKNAIIGDENLAKSPLPTENDSRWVESGIVSKLYIYPVKSFAGISVPSAQIEKVSLKIGKKFNEVLKSVIFSTV